jgi:hypothetical protein
MAKTLLNLNNQAQGRILTLGTETSLPASLLLNKGTGTVDTILADIQGSINVTGDVYIAKAPTQDPHGTNKLYVDSLVSSAVGSIGKQKKLSFTGAQNAVNTVFTITEAKAVALESLQVFVNGILQSTGDYTANASTVTFSYAPESDDKLVMYGTAESQWTGAIGGGSGESGSSSATLMVSVTYSELMGHIGNSTLVEGAMYKITNFQTKHIIPNSAHLNVQGTVYEDKLTAPNNLSEGVEELVVIALSSNKVSQEAFSIQFPQDTIRIDLTSNLCEDGTTPRTGKIVYRKDTVRNIELYYDWRNVRFIRYKLNPAVYNASTSYASGSIVINGGNIFVCLIANTIGITPTHSYTNYNWAQIYAKNTGLQTVNLHIGHLAANNKLGRWTVPTDTTSYRHVWTFNNVTNEANETVSNAASHTGLLNISYQSTTTNNGYNNIVYYAPINTGVWFRNVSIGYFCSDMTFVRGGVELTIGNECVNNLFAATVEEGSISTYSSNNIFMEGGEYPSTGFDAGISMNGNLWYGLNHCSLENYVQNNITKRVVRFNHFGVRFSGNVLHNYMYNSKTSPSLENSVFRGTVDHLTVNTRIINCTFNGNLTRVILSTDLNAKTIASTYSDINISIKSATKMFYLTIDDNAVPTYVAVV